MPNGTYGRDMHDERMDEPMHDPLGELCPVPLMISEVIKMWCDVRACAALFRAVGEAA